MVKRLNLAKETKKRSRYLTNISTGIMILVTAYAGNGLLCFTKSSNIYDEKYKTPAYQECSKINQELGSLTHIKNYPQYLSEKGKKDLDERVTLLTEKKSRLEKELSPYDDKANVWMKRAVNPLNYFK